MTQPSVTIGITNFNYSKFVCSAIDSALSQSYPIQEIVIVDDKSTDDSISVISNHLKDKQTQVPVKLIPHQTNQGLPSSRNTILKNINTEFIAFLDADDLYGKDKVKRSIETFLEFPDIACVYSDYNVLDLTQNRQYREYKFDYDIGLLQQVCIISTNSVFRTAFFKDVGLYNPEVKVAEDYELYLRAFRSHLFYHLPEPLFLYRLHGKNITMTQQQQMAQNEREYKRRLLNV